MTRQGKVTELCRYAEAYEAKLDQRAPKTYCANAAIAEQSRITVQLQVTLPEKLTIAEVDLCNLLGN